MTEHPEFFSLLVRAAEGRLAPDDQARLDGHLAGCLACRDALEAQRAVRAALASRPPTLAAPDFQARVMAAIGRTRVARPRSLEAWIERWDFRRWTWRLAPVAAALVVAVLSVLYGTTGRLTAASSSAAAGQLPVSAALWAPSVSDTSVLSLMLEANPDDSLASHLTTGKAQQ